MFIKSKLRFKISNLKAQKLQFIFLFLFALIATNCLYAKKLPTFAERKNLDLLTKDSSLSVTTDLIGLGSFPTDTLWRNGYCFSKSIGRIVLGLKSFPTACPADSFELIVLLRLSLMDKNSNVSVVDTSLKITYHKHNRKHIEKSIYSNFNTYYLKAEILNISDTTLRRYAYLEAQIEQERNYCNFNPDINIPSIISINYISETNEYEVVLDSTLISKAEFYDLEWTFEDGYTYNSLANIKYASEIWFDFRQNSNRIQITNHRYRLSNIFDKGYLLFRVRAVGLTPQNDFIESQWSIPTNGQLSAINNKNYTSINNSNQRIHEKNLNWMYTSTYAEEGRKKEVIAYFDGLLKERQTVTKSYSDSVTMVSEKIYDHIGRVGVETIPVPTFEKVFKYYNLFNRDDSLKAYTYNDFEFSEGCEAISNPMHTGYGSSKYYSVNNNLLALNNTSIYKQFANHIPDAEGFPFTQIEYMPDNTNRVRRRSGVGGNHKLGSGHETKFYYGVPEQVELNMLFGTNVGYAKHYKKSLVVDANNQISVSYSDLKGNTIATALAGASPENTTILSSNLGIEHYLDTLIGYEDTLLLDDAVIINKSILVTDDNLKYSFFYSLKPQKYLPACNNVNVCYDCIYDLSIVLTDECGNEILNLVKQINNNDENIDTICNANPYTYSFLVDNELNSNDGFIEVMLQRGVYYLSKKLTINEQAFEFYYKDYIENRKCKSFNDFLSEAYLVYDTNSCFETCESCLESIGEKSDYLASQITLIINAGNIPTLNDTNFFNSEYNNLLNMCNERCSKTVTTCDIYYALIRNDVIPGGQYARYKINNSNGEFIADTDSPLNFLLQGNGQNFSLTYKNINWFITNGDTINGQFISYSNMTTHQFVTNWKDTFADIIISQHPEYCRYLNCINNNSFDAFHYDFLNTNTYDEAYQKGYLNPLEPIIDSFFYTGRLGSNILNDTKTRLNNYLTLNENQDDYTFSIWDLAVMKLYCNEENLSASQIYNCVQSNKDSILFCNTNKDFFWQSFKSIYIGLRLQLIDSLQELGNCNNVSILSAINSELYTIRIPTKSANNIFTEIENNGINSAANQVENAIGNDCQLQCESYIDQWKEQLSGCNLSELELNIVIDSMVQVCRLGCDNYNPLGSKNVSKSLQYAPSIQYKSFKQVLQGVLGTNKFIAGICDDILIDMPKSYNHNYLANNSPFADTCACSESFLDNPMYNSYCSDSILPPNNNCPCLDQSTEINETGKKLLAMSGNSDIRYNCNTCVDCDLIRIAIADFDETYSSFYDSSAVFSSIFTNFINNAIGFNLSYNEYLEFIGKCTNTDFNYINDSLVLTLFKNTFTPPIAGQEDTKYNEYQLIDTCGCDKILNAYLQYKADTNNNYSGFSSYYINNYFCGQPVPDGFTWSTLAHCIGYILVEIPVNNEADLINKLNNLPTDWTPGQWHNNLNGYINRYDAFLELRTNSPIFIPRELNDCSESINCCLKLCNKPFNIIRLKNTNPCVEMRKTLALNNALQNYNSYIDSLDRNFRFSYIKKCMGSAKQEKFVLNYEIRQYHYTLYYYDQAGNLVQTIPPKGVIPDASATFNELVNSKRKENKTQLPAHSYLTIYKYNTLNAVLWQQTPDAGISNTYYDNVGRVVVSQNSKQASSSKYSYTNYDGLGRIVEVGEILPQFSITHLIARDTMQLRTWMAVTAKKQITNTYYDAYNLDVIDTLLFNPINLRNRVSYSTYKEFNGSKYNHAVHYSYDITGNVKSLLREIPDLAFIGQDYKIIDYDYDLISGKVNKVVYQNQEVDQYIHNYFYDLDNRLTMVKSGRAMELLDKDASYLYYMHGPLARMELGQLNIQGVDYAYTISGWLKGVNSVSGNKLHDIGRDGALVQNGFSLNQYFAQDEYGFALNYFNNDYVPIGNIQLSELFTSDYLNASFLNNAPNLYNGNISAMLVNIKKLGTPMAYAYKYDQLNRLSQMHAYNNFDSINNQWVSSGAALDAYKNYFTYDANGNILTQLRNGSSNKVDMDNLTYNYYSGTNKLSYVQDAVSNINYDDDVDNQSKTDNYQYDLIGNLVRDDAEEIDSIYWNVYGKITRIKRKNNSIKPDLEFEYTPDGHRAVKVVIPKTQDLYRYYTYYVRDAQGNIMATYQRSFNKIIDFDSIPYQGINDTLVKYYGNDAFGAFTYNNYNANNSITSYIYNNTTTIEQLNILNEFDFSIYVMADAQVKLNQIINALDKNVFLDYLSSWLVNQQFENTFLSNLCNNSNYEFFVYLLQNNSNKTQFLSNLHNSHQTVFIDLYEHLSQQQYTDFAQALVWLDYADNTSIIDFTMQHLNCSDLINLILYLPSLNQQIAMWLNNQTDLYTYLHMGIGSDAVLYDILVGFNAGMVRQALIDANGYNAIYTWYYLNNPQQVLQFSAKHAHGLVSTWQTAQAPHGMAAYFGFVQQYYGQTAYDFILQLYQSASKTYLDSFNLSEWHIYGSARLGIYQTYLNLVTAKFNANTGSGGIFTEVGYGSAVFASVNYQLFNLQRGEKVYELTNHLGNVLLTVSDKRLPQCSATVVTGHTAYVISATDYSAGGMIMPGRVFSSPSYRYGYQGSEKDAEITGSDGTHITTYFREADLRILQWWTPDPKYYLTPWESPYSMMGRNPILNVDPKGDYFWEKSNVRQARSFAKQTGGEFEKWKGQDGKRYASVTIRSSEAGTGSSNADGTERTLDQQNVTSYMFRPGQDRSDLLMKSGVGFYESMRANATGFDRVSWALKSGDAWANGWGEYDRDGQAPSGIKFAVGLIPLVSVPSAGMVLTTGKNIFEEEATTKTDKVVAGLEVSVGGVLPIAKFAKPVLETSKAIKVIERTNQAIQLTNDLGGFDKLKEWEKKE